MSSADTIPSVEAPAHVTPSLKKYEATLQDEMKIQAALYPTPDDVPGCMQLFDEFISCYALGPQIRHIYRHGQIHPCTEQFDTFKYCMSLKSSATEEERLRKWVRRRAEWWAGRRVGGSSEDVWDVRSTPLVGFPPNFGENERKQEQQQAKV